MNEDTLMLLGLSNSEEPNYQLPSPELLQFYRDLKNRTYWINFDINSGLVDLIQLILRCNQEDKGKPVEERVPIKIYINSDGGDLAVCKAITNTIEASTTPVMAIGVGTVASAAGLIFLSCPTRYLYKDASIVLHDGSAQIGGNARDVINFTETYKKQLEVNIQYIISKTNYSEEEVRNNMKSDWYIDAEEAIANGVANKIVTNLDEII